MKNFILIIFLIQFTACSSFEMHLTLGTLKARPKKILIGLFERRTIEYNPYVIKNFKDSMRFEFFKLGYKSEIMILEPFYYEDEEKKADKKNQNPITINLDKNKIKSLCSEKSADIYIQGAISETEIGDFVNKKVSAIITLLIYNSNGKKIGEAHYITSKSMNDAKVIRDISRYFVTRLHGKFP